MRRRPKPGTRLASRMAAPRSRTRRASAPMAPISPIFAIPTATSWSAWRVRQADSARELAGAVRSRTALFYREVAIIIPAQAGTQEQRFSLRPLDPRLRGGDGERVQTERERRLAIRGQAGVVGQQIEGVVGDDRAEMAAGRHRLLADRLAGIGRHRQGLPL